MRTTTSPRSFRVGRVKGYLRGSTWYLCYHENGTRRRPRVGPDLQQARTLAAQTNGQLAGGTRPVLSFEPTSIPDLRQRWLDHHEHVLRSSVATIARYRAATDHLLTFVRDVKPVRLASLFGDRVAEDFVRHLRTVAVASNGRRGAPKRPLMDKGVRYILETCRALFNYAAKRRHLAPYAGNPFADIQTHRIPIEDAKRIVLFTPEQERQFLAACDDWQFPVFLTLLTTGLRPGELAHVLLPDDVDLEAGVLRVRNKRALGWQVKTRNERDVPLAPDLVAVLRVATGARRSGPAFTRPGFRGLETRTSEELSAALSDRILADEQALCRAPTRQERLAAAKALWWEVGAVREDRIRSEFMRVTAKVGLASVTMPKLLRHMFATALQDGDVDPLIRNRLMGHAPATSREPSAGLGMTAVYSHCRPETVRRQLESALAMRPALEEARRWLRQRGLTVAEAGGTSQSATGSRARAKVDGEIL